MVTMHVKSESEVTSLAASSPPHSPRRPMYYVMSPSQHDADKLSIVSTPTGSPLHHPPRHHRYGSSSIHHSLESSTTRFSASLKNGNWHKISQPHFGGSAASDADEVEDDEEEEKRPGAVCYGAIFAVGFVVLFSLFSIILWGASRAYKPEITIKAVVFKKFNVQAGMDLTGVPTQMLSINSTVQIKVRNTATFFGVHVSSSPLELYYYDLQIASGWMKEFFQNRKSGRIVTTTVAGTQIPLYGGSTTLSSRTEGGGPAVAALNLTFTMQAKAHVLGRLVRSTFYRHVNCGLVLREDRLGRAVNLKDCHYRE